MQCAGCKKSFRAFFQWCYYFPILVTVGIVRRCRVSVLWCSQVYTCRQNGRCWKSGGKCRFDLIVYSLHDRTSNVSGMLKRRNAYGFQPSTLIMSTMSYFLNNSRERWPDFPRDFWIERAWLFGRFITKQQHFCCTFFVVKACKCSLDDLCKVSAFCV